MLTTPMRQLCSTGGRHARQTGCITATCQRTSMDSASSGLPSRGPNAAQISAAAPGAKKRLARWITRLRLSRCRSVTVGPAARRACHQGCSRRAVKDAWLTTCMHSLDKNLWSPSPAWPFADAASVRRAQTKCWTLRPGLAQQRTAVGVQALDKLGAQRLEQRAPGDGERDARAVGAQQLGQQRAPSHLRAGSRTSPLCITPTSSGCAVP
jgi:hypothetical protein